MSFKPATSIKRTDPIWKFSNPNVVQKRAKQYLGKNAKVYRSTRKNKKYMIEDPNHHFVSFGQMQYEDYTKHKNKRRRHNYLTRSAKIKGNWKKNKYSPNNLSRKILW